MNEQSSAEIIKSVRELLTQAVEMYDSLPETQVPDLELDKVIGVVGLWVEKGIAPKDD